MTSRFKMLVNRSTFMLIVALFLSGNVIVYAAREEIHRTDRLFAALGVLLLIITGVVYGAYRVRYFHPYHRPDYARFLAQSPWTWDVPMPLGPVLLVCEDLVFVACLAFMAYFTSAFSGLGELFFEFGPYVPAVGAVLVVAGFFMSYLSFLAISTLTDIPTTAAVAFLVPLMVYPHFNLIAAAGVVAFIYIVLVMGVRRTLGRFPWNMPDWTATADQKYLSEARVKGLIGWPHHPLGPWDDEQAKAIKPREVLLAAALAAWWAQSCAGLVVHASNSTWEAALPFTSDPVEGVCPAPLFLGTCIMLAATRTVIYVWGCLPPISLFGRIATGRWIIPGYDKIAIAPLLLLLFGWVGPRCLYTLGVSAFLLWAVCVFIAFALALGLGPSLQTWRYTGQYRMVNVRPQTTISGRASQKDWRNIEINIFNR